MNMSNLPHPEVEYAQFVAVIAEVPTEAHTKRLCCGCAVVAVLALVHLFLSLVPFGPLLAHNRSSSSSDPLVLCFVVAAYKINNALVWSPHRKVLRPWIEVDDLERLYGPKEPTVPAATKGPEGGSLSCSIM